MPYVDRVCHANIIISVGHEYLFVILEHCETFID